LCHLDLRDANIIFKQLEVNNKHFTVAAKEALKQAVGKKGKLEVDIKHCGKLLHFDEKLPTVRVGGLWLCGDLMEHREGGLLAV
jgi:hypothetical protein